MFLPFQAGVNSQLSRMVASPLLAAFASFSIGTLILFTSIWVFRIPMPEWKTVTTIPWGLWTGGLFGAFIVLFTIIATPKLGATTLLAFILTGQMMVSLIVDHTGLFEFPIQPINPGRIAGVLFLILGAYMIKKF